MFPINSNNINDPMPYIDHSSILLHKHFGNNDNIISSKQEDQLQQQQQLPFPIFHFPSPYCDYNNHFDLQLELEDYLPQLHHIDLPLIHQHNNNTDNSVSASGGGGTTSTIINMPDSSYCTKTKKAARPSKRDRHSKIKTAKGLRDRRMRLSLEVAREFFGLQDMLGYDKASKTVEWLLIQARPEIKKLGRSSSCSPSSTSEGEVVSSSGILIIDDIKAVDTTKAKPSTKRDDKKARRKARKPAFRPLARDLREKARARAKARTKAKIMWSSTTNQSQFVDDESNHDGGVANNHIHDLNNFSSWSSIESTTVEESGTNTHDHNNNNNACHDREQIGIHGDIGDESWSIMNNPIFTCLQNTAINQEHQFTSSFLSFGKTWG